ncbi:hypothetical protein ABZ915_17705 [Streptomyces sp. NPDC046915]|uniref:hypothetical protein n=1 Tax=Streptomyces sp. NPDC046915 TaxID=3155257 RepID=UPI0033E80A90
MPHVGLLVSDELLEELPQALALLQATEVARKSNDAYTTMVTLDMPYVPDGAVKVEPIFQSTPGGVRVRSLAWHYAASSPDGGLTVYNLDEGDDPQVQCWHTEAGSPCDWNICRQPERLAAGDYGTDPAA